MSTQQWTCPRHNLTMSRRNARLFGCPSCRADVLSAADRERRALAQLDADAQGSAETEPATPSPVGEPEAQPVPARPHYSPARSDVRSGDVATCREADRMDRLRGCPRPMGA